MSLDAVTRTLKTGQLVPSRIAQAFALIRMTLPERGIATVDNEQGYIVGLATYRVQHGLRDNPALKAEHVVAVDLIRQEEVARILLTELECLARRFGCVALHVQLPHNDPRIPWGGFNELLASHGHTIDALCLRKPITPIH